MKDGWTDGQMSSQMDTNWVLNGYITKNIKVPNSRKNTQEDPSFFIIFLRTE